MYKIAAKPYGTEWSVMVIGTGGTGGYVAESLCRLVPHNIDIILVDYDRVEERNLNRQNFFPEDIGKIKSEALAERLSRKYDRAIGYSIKPIRFTDIVGGVHVVIGCVDNGLARADIEQKIKDHNTWWIDAGNGENYGQIIVGDSSSKTASFNLKNQTCYRLPLPSIQRPELLQELPQPEPALNCVQIAEQGPVVNQIMAAITVETFRRLITDSLTWMQLIINMDTGTMNAVMADPETLSSVLGKNNIQTQ